MDILITAMLTTGGCRHFDLYQLHAITDVEKDVKAVFAQSGAMEVLADLQPVSLIPWLHFNFLDMDTVSDMNMVFFASN